MLLFLEQATETITMVHCQLESTTAIREYLKNNNPSLFSFPSNPLPISTPASKLGYRVFSHDVTAVILVSQNNETAAMLVSQTNLLGVELFSYANALFCSNKFAKMLAT